MSVINNIDFKTSNIFPNIHSEYLKELFDASEYPFDILPKIKSYILKIVENGLEGYSLLREGILIGKNVEIANTATIIAPCIIGQNVEIRPGAYIRGNVIIGDGCVIGNSSELKNAILLDKVQVPHFNYVGDSILGNNAHLGAGVILSNLKGDNKAVVIHTVEGLETNLRKVGSFLGDNVDVGCNSVLNPGTVILENSRVYPLSSLRGTFPKHKIIKTKDELIEIE